MEIFILNNIKLKFQLPTAYTSAHFHTRLSTQDVFNFLNSSHVYKLFLCFNFYHKNISEVKHAFTHKSICIWGVFLLIFFFHFDIFKNFPLICRIHLNFKAINFRSQICLKYMINISIVHYTKQKFYIFQWLYLFILYPWLLELLYSYSSDSTPSLGTSICHGRSPTKKNKNKPPKLETVRKIRQCSTFFWDKAEVVFSHLSLKSFMWKEVRVEIKQSIEESRKWIWQNNLRKLKGRTQVELRN